MLNMFRMLIHPSSGACDLFVELFHGLYCSGSMCVRVTLWFGWGGVVSVLQAEACNTDTTPTQPHRNSNTHRTKYNTTNVVIQQNSCKLLMMDILMSETCWAHRKWNKIASDINFVFHSWTIVKNVRWRKCLTTNFQNVVFFLLGDSPSSEFYVPTVWNTLSAPSL